jgi:hypothetical protein
MVMQQPCIFTNLKSTRKKCRYILSLTCVNHRSIITLDLSFAKDYVKKFATEEALREQEAQEAAHLSSDSESSMSDFSEDEAQDMEL